jgi:Fe-S-cluster containining protein
MEFDMIYDEEKLKILAKGDLGEFSRIYLQIQEMYPLKLKILKHVTCKRCGFCCTSCNCMLSKQDIDLLCRYLECSFEELYEKYMDKNARIPYLKLPCPFLNKDKECDVYPARPKTCREFPFNEFTVIVDPCPLGKDIRHIVEEIEGPITQINEDMQKAAEGSDEFFNHVINNDTMKDTGKHLRMNINIDILEKMIGYLKHEKKERLKRNKIKNR